MRTRWIIIAAAVLILSAQSLVAGQFASLNGKFRFSYPDDWHQLDYRLIDSALFGGKTYNYEAVFAPTNAATFEDGDYLVLTVDNGERYSPAKIDSTLELWKKTLAGEIKNYGPSAEFTPLWRPVEVSYWPKGQIASVYTEAKITTGDHTRNQLVVLFSELGSANFYFYGPDSTWSGFQPIITSIIKSYSTENVESALPHQQVKVVDAEKLKEGSSPLSANSKYTSSFVIFGSAAVVLIIFFAIRARKKRQDTASHS
jgi:hypothetical protein